MVIQVDKVGAFRVHETVIILPYCLFNEFVVLKLRSIWSQFNFVEADSPIEKMQNPFPKM